MKISVLLPVYNTKEAYLREAIESILSQTFSDFELIILNDCSTDQNVEDVIKSYTDKRIKYFKNEKNLGISLSRNKLIDLAQGEYLAIMDHDDISLPTRFEKQIKVLDESPNIGVVGCYDYLLSKHKTRKYPLKDKAIKDNLFTGCVVIHPGTMFRKSVILENNIRYKEKFTPAEDYAFYCDLIDKTSFATIPEVLLHYRDHETNTSIVNRAKMLESISNVSQYVRAKFPERWEKIKEEEYSKISVRLFGFIPFLEIDNKKTKIKCSIFGIPFLSIRVKKFTGE